MLKKFYFDWISAHIEKETALCVFRGMQAVIINYALIVQIQQTSII